MTRLVVVHPFGSYKVGDPITDPATIDTVLAGPNRGSVVTVVGEDATVAAAPANEATVPAADQAASTPSPPSLVVATDLRAGTPVTFSRAANRLVAARSDTKALSFVMGVLTADVAAGFAAAPALGVVTLADWTSTTGAAALTAGAPYYLDASGGLTPTPDPTRVSCIATVGVSLSPTSLMVAPQTPIQL